MFDHFAYRLHAPHRFYPLIFFMLVMKSFNSIRGIKIQKQSILTGPFCARIRILTTKTVPPKRRRLSIYDRSILIPRNSGLLNDCTFLKPGRFLAVRIRAIRNVAHGLYTKSQMPVHKVSHKLRNPDTKKPGN